MCLLGAVLSLAILGQRSVPLMGDAYRTDPPAFNLLRRAGALAAGTLALTRQLGLFAERPLLKSRVCRLGRTRSGNGLAGRPTGVMM